MLSILLSTWWRWGHSRMYPASSCSSWYSRGHWQLYLLLRWKRDGYRESFCQLCGCAVCWLLRHTAVHMLAAHVQEKTMTSAKSARLDGLCITTYVLVMLTRLFGWLWMSVTLHSIHDLRKLTVFVFWSVLDIDECGTELGTCSPDSYCFNIEGSFECRGQYYKCCKISTYILF